MTLALAPHVFAADTGGDLVLLDVRADRYFCLPAGAGATLHADRRGLTFAAPDVAQELAVAGLGSVGGDIGPRADVPRSPRRDLPPLRSSRLTAADGAAAARATADALLAYAGRSLPSLLEFARRRAEDPPDAATPGAMEIAQAFRRWAPFTPLPAKCLLRSFLLLRALRRAGEDAVWVFGVRTRPFSAHCWLQAGDLALDDHWGRLAKYAPILAV